MRNPAGAHPALWD